MCPTARVNLWPDREPIEVDDAEYAELKAQGLLLEDDPPAPIRGQANHEGSDQA